MRISFKLCALALTFGLFSVGTVAGAAFLPLEQLGQKLVIVPLDVHSFQRPCHFDFAADFAASPTT